MLFITIRSAIILVCVLSSHPSTTFGTASDTHTSTTKNDCVVDAHGTTTCQVQGGQPQQRQHRYQYLKYCHDVRSDCEALLRNEFRSKNDDYTAACITNFDVMSKQCAKTCRFCSARDPNPKTIVSHKPVAVDRIFADGAPQILDGATSIDAWLHVRTMEDNMYNIVYSTDDDDDDDDDTTDDQYEDVRIRCQLRHERCTQWAVQGECETNPSYMTTACAPACMSCRNVH